MRSLRQDKAFRWPRLDSDSVGQRIRPSCHLPIPNRAAEARDILHPSLIVVMSSSVEIRDKIWPRSASTISREVSRNGGLDRYRAARSDQAAWDRALRPKLCKLACRPVLSRTVSIKLRQQWSPEQIAGWLKRTYPGELQNQVSHETIYRSLFIQARGVLKKELLEHLRAKRTIRRSKHASLKRNGLGQIKNSVSISERPHLLKIAPCRATGRAT